MTTMSGSDGASAGGSGGRGWFTPPPSDAAPAEHTAPTSNGTTPAAPGAAAPAQQAPPAERGAPARQGPGARQAAPVHQAAAPARAETPAYAEAPVRTETHPASAAQAAAHTAAGGTHPAAVGEPGGTEPGDAELIRASMEELERSSDAATAYFYALLFVQYPHLREMFPAAMDGQRDRLFRALLTAVRLFDDGRLLGDYLANLGRGHRKYGTLPTHYPAVGECLMAALARYAPHSWGPRTEAAWVRAYTAISQKMIDAAAEAERHSPAWWDAEIVSHERRTPQVAVITVRPDQPYPFRAGQYTSLETPWWPRVWRHYSFASAPRTDGLLTFHVKSVPAGWVSSSLVQRARPGDVLRLGPPAGSMTVDHRADSGLLCLGGGTGIAPIKALVEDVAGRGTGRPVEVFYGARTNHDLYDLDTMLGLQDRYDWLSVRPVVATGGTLAVPDALAGELPDAVRRYGPWPAYDGYLSGPPGMIRSGVEALVGLGIPTHRIRHDSLEELVAQGA
ncbi:globin domain-containing protein [Streptomyces reniochalinae]|uniref:nitric oxide dioxygenase n=1 Tax=Streptomyces reniochalinae TaxID=2250578 RepID=A0A367EI69_9ACTN|nr:globin domain-containing protein [Streptomyces reniochalinae]RCG17067.1 flavohemoprotein [Streptomyces reniochalinae]